MNHLELSVSEKVPSSHGQRQVIDHNVKLFAILAGLIVPDTGCRDGDLLLFDVFDVFFVFLKLLLLLFVAKLFFAVLFVDGFIRIGVDLLAE